MKLLEFPTSTLAPKPVYCPKRQGPSPANLRAAKRILEHRRRNWPNCIPVPQSRTRYLPKFREVGT